MKTYYCYILLAFFLFGTRLSAQEVSILVPRGERAFEAITWLPDGRIITPDYINGRLFLIKRNGTIDTLLHGLRGPLGGTCDEGGNYYYSEWGGGTLRRYTPTGMDSVLATNLGNPSGTHYDAPNNRVLVADYTYNRLHAISLADGSAEVLIDSSTVTGLNGPDGIVPAQDGNGFIIANFNDSLFHRYDTLGNVSRFSRLPASAQSGYLVPFQDGYLSAGINSHQLWFITAEGTATVWAGTGEQAFVNGNRLDTVAFSIPNGLALSPDGDSLVISENTTIGQIRLITGLNDLTGLRASPRRGFLDFQLFPQPVHDSFTTVFRLAAPATVTAALLAEDGRVVQAFPARRLPVGELRESWRLKDGLARGTYFLRVWSEDGQEYSGPLLLR